MTGEAATEEVQEALAPKPVTAGTLLRYLAFDRSAIESIAAAPPAIWLAVPLVLAGGLARDYDGEDLLSEPWHVFGGLAISTVVSMLMAVLLWLLASWSDDRPPFRRVWPRFVALFWLTAPMAWLYAIPWERMTDPLTATKINVWTLGVVSVWRVTLTTLVASVLFGLPKRAAVWGVLLVSSAVMLYAASRLPVIQIMGGVRRSPSTQFLAGTGFLLGLGSVVGLIVSSFAYLASTFPRFRSLRGRTSLVGGRVAGSAWAFAAASVVVGLCLLPIGQGEQRNRGRFESLVLKGDLNEAASFAASRQPHDFPPHWEPLPERLFGYGKTPSLRTDFLTAASDAPVWLRRAVMDSAVPPDFDVGRGWRTPRDEDRLRRDLSTYLSLPWTVSERQRVEESLRYGNWTEDEQAIVNDVLGLPPESPDEPADDADAESPQDEGPLE